MQKGSIRGQMFGHRSSVLGGGNRGSVYLVVKTVNTQANAQLGIDGITGEVVTELLPTPNFSSASTFAVGTLKGTKVQEGDQICELSSSVLKTFPTIEQFVFKDEGTLLRTTDGDLAIVHVAKVSLDGNFMQYKIYCRGLTDNG